MKYLLLLYFSLSVFFIQAQNLRSSLSVKKIDILMPENNASDTLRTLDADFLAVTVFGQAPLQVQFKDISTGNPTLWTWKFGDGGESTVKHPVYTYEQPGIYSVKLTVSDGTGTSTKTKTAYIAVQPAGLCDSLGVPFQGDYTYYTIIANGSGYVSGNNSYGDLAKASYFYDYEPGSQLVAGIFDFAIAKRLLSNDVGIKFKVWDNDGSLNRPGTILDSLQINISGIVQNVDYGQSTVVVFEPPVLVNGPFFLGVELPQIYGDTLVLFTNEKDMVPVGNGWEQQNTGDWFPYSDEQNSWGLDIDHTIFPVVCQSTGIDNQLISDNILIYPNPVSLKINIAFLQQPEKDLKIRLSDVTGRVVAAANILGNQASIDVGQLRPGTFILSLISSKSVITRKIIIER